MQLVVRNAEVYSDGGFFSGSVAVDDGRIVAVTSEGESPVGDVEIDAAGAMLLPGGMDMHVHFRDPGFTEKEDFGTGSASAALGGITTVLDMPNTRPAVLDADVLLAKRDSIEGRSFVDFGLIAAADPSNLAAIPGLAAAGAAAFKMFLYERKDAPPAGVLDDAVVLELMSAIAATGLRVHVHAENDDIVKAGRRAAASSSSAWITHAASRPALAEIEAISRAILFAESVGVPLHVCHLSSAGGASLVAEAKRRGQAVTAEVTPQHVLRDDTSYERLEADLVMVPPVRSSADREALATALADGTVDVVATDHAPHTDADKTGGPLTISTGLVGVQWSYPLMVSEALAGRQRLNRVIDAMSTRPAMLLGLQGRKGVIRPGADADFVLMDQWTSLLDRDDLASKGRSTPFDGARVLCSVRTTVVGGRVQVHDGELVGEPTGRFVTPMKKKVS